MSTSAQISPAWKDEVNRRLAEHRGRKGTAGSEPQMVVETQRNSSRRAMEAAARVAARYANAPSYSDVLANEARAALDSTDSASHTARHAQTAAQPVLAGFEAAIEPVSEPVVEWPMASAAAAVVEYSAPAADFATGDDFFNAPIVSPSDFAPEPFADIVRSELPAAYAPIATVIQEPAPLRWDLELPAHPEALVDTRAARGQEFFETGAERWWRPGAAELERAEPEQIEIVEPVAIHANLIEFPRELVAPRKARPRLAEGLSAAQEASLQLSIFEVDPVSISTEPLAEEFTASAQPWAAPTWSGMELEAQPAPQRTHATQRIPTTQRIYEVFAAPAAEPVYDVFTEPAPQPQAAVAFESATVVEPAAAVQAAREMETATAVEAATALQPAPATLRLMAMVVDGALIAGSLLGAAIYAASRSSVLPGLRVTEIGLGLAFIVAAILYQTFFFSLGRATPGMKYAHIRLTGFDGLTPARAERYKRMGALLVSVLPAGLGLAWSLFDKNHLSWHDRLSRTYPCKHSRYTY